MTYWISAQGTAGTAPDYEILTRVTFDQACKWVLDNPSKYAAIRKVMGGGA